MVIATSDSTNTLVSLDDTKELFSSSEQRSLRRSSSPASSPLVTFRHTALLLPFVATDELYDDDDDQSITDDESCCCYNDEDTDSGRSDDSSFSCKEQHPLTARSNDAPHLYLPTQGRTLDESLLRVPSLRDARDELVCQSPVSLDALASAPTTPSKSSNAPPRLLYVAQGELAHCTPTQTDVLVSDRATTCHILVLRSTADGVSTSTEPLCTMAHIDGTDYTSCIRQALREQYNHHQQNKDCSSSSSNVVVNMDIHIVGGYDDDSSRDLSTWLLHTLSDCAEEYTLRNIMHCTVRTVCVSAMNADSVAGSPILRGLALHCATGRVFLPSVSTTGNVLGPAPALRSARLWSPPQQQQQERPCRPSLYIIHTAHSDDIVLAPFLYHFSQTHHRPLLTWSDECLLQTCSTSPQCESDDFCDGLRSTLSFMRSTPWTSVFGCNNNADDQRQALRFRRCPERPNEWVAVSCP